MLTSTVAEYWMILQLKDKEGLSFALQDVSLPLPSVKTRTGDSADDVGAWGNLEAINTAEATKPVKQQRLLWHNNFSVT